MPTSIELTEEQIEIAKQEVTTAVVTANVRTVTSETDAAFTLEHTIVDIVRVPMDKVVDTIPSVTTVGDLTIVPVFEERLVKQIVLTEEIHIRRLGKHTKINEPVSLRRQMVDIHRTAAGDLPDND